MRKHPVQQQTSRELEWHVTAKIQNRKVQIRCPEHRDHLCTGIFMPPSKEAQNSADDSPA